MQVRQDPCLPCCAGSESEMTAYDRMYQGAGMLRDRTHDQGEAQLLQILQQGVTTFISLQVTSSGVLYT
jgi:hypothetical protein